MVWRFRSVMGRSRRKKLPAEPMQAHIESLSQDGRGVTRVAEKTVFVHGALPGEEVEFRYTKSRRRYDEGVTTAVLRSAAQRVEPRCAHFARCGGCSLQHLSVEAQIEVKQRSLIDALLHIGGVEPARVLPPLQADRHWGYRRKARLGVRYVAKKGRVLVGFRERGSSFITDLSVCEVLHPKVGVLLPRLGVLIHGLSIRERIPQIEVAVGDTACVLVFRVLDPPSEADLDRLAGFAQEHSVAVYLQDQGPDSTRPLNGVPAALSYRLPDFAAEIQFLPNDFTQVNTDVNRAMVRRALELLDPQPGDRVLDLFCGLGNFTLPLARRAASVAGVEADPGLVERARMNAEHNKISNARFFAANLYAAVDREPWMRERFDKALLDPPRSGASEILGHLPRLGVESILYVSCYPATLARDAGRLVSELGYDLSAAGVMDMFPHTAHVESIALFERRQGA